MNNNVEIQVSATATVDLTDSLQAIGVNFLTLYEDQWFLVAILMAFAASQVVHAVLRGFFVHWRNLTKALYIWATHVGVGALACYQLVESVDGWKLVWFTGLNSIALYYGLLWVASRWFPMPRLARFLSLRETKMNEKGEVEFGETIQFLRK